MIAHSVFCVGSLRQRKFKKIFDSRKQHSENSCVSVSSMFNPFGCHFIDGRYENNLSASVKNIYDGSRKGQRQSSSMMFSGSQMRSIMSRATVIPDSAAEERRS